MTPRGHSSSVRSDGSWECWNHIWQSMAPPKVQSFAWRLLRLALPGAASRSSHIQPFCKRCGQLENDIHLLFSWQFVTAFWFLSPLAIRIYYLLSLDQNLILEVINTISTTYQDQTLWLPYFLSNGTSRRQEMILLSPTESEKCCRLSMQPRLCWKSNNWSPDLREEKRGVNDSCYVERARIGV